MCPVYSALGTVYSCFSYPIVAVDTGPVQEGGVGVVLLCDRLAEHKQEM